MSLVIIADDDEMVVDIVRTALEARGHVVGGLKTGRSVRDIVELKRPDVVILDCVMEVSGIIALKEIRASDKAYATPVLMLTSRCSAGDEDIARLAGADDYLRKPFDPDLLVVHVEALIEKRNALKARVEGQQHQRLHKRERHVATYKTVIDPTVFDVEALAMAQRFITPERLLEHLGALDRLFRMVVDSVFDDAILQEQAHKIVSQAGQLGLARMAECARQVEHACRNGSGQAAAVLRCQEAIEDIRLYAMPVAGAVCGVLPAQSDH